MPASNATRFARLRANATGEKYQKAFHAVSARPSEGPILAEPSRSQERLEGAIFARMYALRFIPKGKIPKGPWGPFGIKRVTPSPDRMVIELEEWANPYELIQGLMPVIDRDADSSVTEVSGVPGLRARDHDLGVSLFFPGLDGEVIVTGLSAGEWEDIHARGYDGPHSGCPAKDSPEAWTLEEQRYLAEDIDHVTTRGLPTDLHVLGSAMLRRIGLLNGLNSRSTSTWEIAPRKGVAIEVFQEEYDLASHEAFIEEVTSPLMSPPLTCVYRELDEDTNYRRLRFTTPRSSGFLEIRLRQGR